MSDWLTDFYKARPDVLKRDQLLHRQQLPSLGQAHIGQDFTHGQAPIQAPQLSMPPSQLPQVGGIGGQDEAQPFPMEVIQEWLRRAGEAQKGQAYINAQLPYLQQQGMQQANAAGLKAELDALPQINPNDPRFSYTPLANAPMPVRTMQEIPNRPAPGFDPMSGILAAIAGIVDPRGAGGYHTSPQQAAIGVAGQQYGDALTHMNLAQQQADMQYNDALRSRDAELQNAIYNRQGALGAAERLGGAQDKLGYTKAGLLGGKAQAETSAGVLGGLGDKAATAAGLGATANNAMAQIALEEKRFEDAQRVFLTTKSAQAKAAAAYQMAMSRIAVAQLQAAERERVGQERNRQYGRRTDAMSVWNAPDGLGDPNSPMDIDTQRSLWNDSFRAYQSGVETPRYVPQGLRATPLPPGQGTSKYTGDINDPRLAKYVSELDKTEATYKQVRAARTAYFDKMLSEPGKYDPYGVVQMLHRRFVQENPTAGENLFPSWAVTRWLSIPPEQGGDSEMWAATVANNKNKDALDAARVKLNTPPPAPTPAPTTTTPPAGSASKPGAAKSKYTPLGKDPNGVPIVGIGR